MDNHLALILKARGLSLGAHHGMGQLRKFTGEPYAWHPMRAAEMAREYGYGWEVVCGCYLHDTVEDTSVTLDLIEEEFGPVVRRIVKGVTNPASRESRPDLNRAGRFAVNLAHLKEQELDCKAVRVFDVFDNLRDAEKADAKFANMLIKEKPIVLAVCREANYSVYGQCMRRIDEITAHLKARGELK